MPKSASDMDTGQTKISIDDNTFYRAVIVSVVLSGLIFGLSHSLNLNFAEPRGVMIQVLGTFLMGMVLTGIYYRTGNLAAVIFLHAINDLAAVFPYMILRSNDTVTNVISNYDMTDVLLLLPYIFVLIVILRRNKVMEILTLYNNQ